MKFFVKRFLIPAALVLLFVLSASAQSSVKELQRYMAEVREKPYRSLPASILDDEKNESQLLDVLAPYYTDTLKMVRQKAFYITRRIGQKSTVPGIQSRAIASLSLALNEKDTGIRGSALDALTQFNKASFPPAVRDSIGESISPNSANLEALLKLAGFLELQKYSSAIQSILSSSANANIKWAARLALARMGDPSATDWIANKLNTANVNDDFVYDVVPDLVYTRQPLIFDYLEGIIKSDEANCSSANPDSDKKILCGYRVLEHIAPVIQNFPLTTDESGDLRVSNYESALKQARAWFAHNHTYALVSDRY